MTSNDSYAQATKLIEMLSSSKIRFKLPLQKGTTERGAKAEREKGATTERLVYGLLAMADQRRAAFQLQPTLSTLGFYATVPGRIIQRFMLWKDDDGKVVSDLAIWDPLGSYWGLGKTGTSWAALKLLKTAEQVEAEYGLSEGKIMADDNGYVTLIDFYDNEKEYVVQSGKVGTGETAKNVSGFLKSEKHGLKYPPVYIMPVGSTPLIDYNEAIKYTDTSIYDGSEELFAIRSRILSYLLTITAQAAYNSFVVYYSDELPEIPANPYVKGTQINMKITDKGEKIVPLFTPVLPADAFKLLADVDRQISTVGIPSILFGGGKETDTASGLNLLSYYAKTVMLPRKQAVEKALEWFAQEAVKQFKENDYSIESLQGSDRLGKDFTVSVKADDMIDNRLVKCELLPDTPQDMAQKTGNATQLTKARIWSLQTARDYVEVEDTDAEQERVFTEDAMADPKVKALLMAEALKEDNPKLAATILENAQKERQAQQTPPPGTPAAPGIVVGPPQVQGVPQPQTIPGQAAKPLNIPPEVMADMANMREAI